MIVTAICCLINMIAMTYGATKLCKQGISNKAVRIILYRHVLSNLCYLAAMIYPNLGLIGLLYPKSHKNLDKNWVLVFKVMFML